MSNGQKIGKKGISLLTRENILGLIVLCFFLILFIFTNFKTSAGIVSFFKEVAYLLMAGTAMTLIILTGNMDISAGTLMGMCGYAAAYVAKMGMPIYVFVPVAILTGMVFAGFNGLLVTKFKVPSLVATLAMVNVHLGIFILLPSGGWVENMKSNFTTLGTTVLAKYFPLTFILSLILFVCLIFYSKYSRFMKKVYAVGGNDKASVLVGINPDHTVFKVFIIEGILMGIAAILFYTPNSIIQANSTFGMEMKFITATVVGGTLISGGKGKLIGTGFGVVLISLIGRAMILFGLQDYYSYAVEGIIIIIAVLLTYVDLDKFTSKKKSAEVKRSEI